MGRNDICPCGSGKKFKKCCEFKGKQSRFHLLSTESKEEKVKDIAAPLFARILMPASVKNDLSDESEGD